MPQQHQNTCCTCRARALAWTVMEERVGEDLPGEIVWQGKLVALTDLIFFSEGMTENELNAPEDSSIGHKFITKTPFLF